MIEIFLRPWSLPDSSLDPALPPQSPLGGFPGQRSHTATPPRLRVAGSLPVDGGSGVLVLVRAGWEVELCWVPACCEVGVQIASGTADFTLLAGTQDGISEGLK